MLQKLSEELRVSSVDVHKISLGEIPSVESMDVAVRQMIKTGVKVPFPANDRLCTSSIVHSTCQRTGHLLALVEFLIHVSRLSYLLSTIMQTSGLLMPW